MEFFLKTANKTLSSGKNESGVELMVKDARGDNWHLARITEKGISLATGVSQNSVGIAVNSAGKMVMRQDEY